MGTNPLLRFMVPEVGDVNGIEALAARAAELDGDTLERLADVVDDTDLTDEHRRRIIDTLCEHRSTSPGLRVRWAHRYAVDAVDAARMLDPDEDNGIRYAVQCAGRGPARLDVWSAIVSRSTPEQLATLVTALLNPDQLPEAKEFARATPEVVAVLAGELARRVHDGVLLPEESLTLSAIDAVARIDRDAAALMFEQMPSPHNWNHPVDVGHLDAAVSVFVDIVAPRAPLGRVAVVARQIRTVPWALYPNARRILSALEERFDADEIGSILDQIDPAIRSGRRFSDLVDDLSSENPPSWDDVIEELQHAEPIRQALCDAARVVYAANPAVTTAMLLELLVGTSAPAAAAAVRGAARLTPVEVAVVATVAPFNSHGLDGLTWVLDASTDRAVTVATWLNLSGAIPAPGCELEQAARRGLLDAETIASLNTEILRVDVEHWSPTVIAAMSPWITSHFDGERAALAVELAGSATFGELAALVAAAG